MAISQPTTAPPAPEPGRLPADIAVPPFMVGLVIIGDEVLSAKVRDENSPALLHGLSDAGLTIGEVSVIADDIHRIAQVVADFSGRFDLVITTGGVGPTHDDRTWQGIALGLGLPLVIHEELVARIEARNGEALTPEQRRLARLPEGTKVTVATGHWPLLEVRNVLVLPGVPSMVAARIPLICARFGRSRLWLATAFFTTDEWHCVAHIDKVVSDYKDLAIGSYPVYDAADHRLRLTFEGPNRERLQSAVQAATAALGAAQCVRVVWQGGLGQSSSGQGDFGLGSSGQGGGASGSLG